MKLDEKFKFEESENTVYKSFGNRNGIERFLPVAKIKSTGDSKDVTFLTQLNLTEDEKKFILKKVSSL